MARKTSIGRQRIPIAKIQKESHRQVTFSKRRAGLFKKASELCTLCGTEIAIVVFSPAKKAFSFGHPNVESVIDRYISKNNLPAPQVVDTQRSNGNARELNSRLTQVLNELEAEKKKGQAIEEMRKASRAENWWEAPVEEMNMNELEQLRIALEELKKNVVRQANSASLLDVKGDRAFTFLGSKATPQQSNVGSGPSPVYNFGYGHIN